MGMGGVRRSYSFCKYLHKNGWNPIVLTVKNIKYFSYDASLLNNINYPVFRTESLDPLRISNRLNLKIKTGNISPSFHNLSSKLFIPDNKIGWFPYATKAGLRLIKGHSIDLIFATAPPYTSLLVGSYLKKVTGLPLVVEFRDPWPYLPYPTAIHKKISEYMKIKVLNSADALVTINKPIASNLPSRTVIIPPGYDPDDFINNNNLETENLKFTITYTGSFFPPRTPVYFLEAVAELISENKIPSGDIKVELIGLHTVQEKKIVDSLGLGNIVDIVSYLPHIECVKRLMQSHLLWIMTDENEKTASTGKIGEYLGVRKPILATVTEGPCAEIIRETDVGLVVPPRDVNAIKNTLLDFYLKFKEGKLVYNTKVDYYSWENLSKKLAKVFDSTL